MVNLNNKYKVYSNSILQENSKNQILFIYSKLIHNLKNSLVASGAERQKIINNCSYIIEILLLSIEQKSQKKEQANQIGAFYLSLLKKLSKILYKQDREICNQIIEEISAMKQHLEKD